MDRTKENGAKKMAEEEGFEPPDPCRSSVFKTDAIGRSATLPPVIVWNLHFLSQPHLARTCKCCHTYMKISMLKMLCS